MLRSRSVCPSMTVDWGGGLREPADVCVYYDDRKPSASVYSAVNERFPLSSSKYGSTNRTGSLEDRLSYGSYSDHKSLPVADQQWLLNESEFINNQPFSFDPYCVRDSALTMKNSTGNSNLSNNGNKKHHQKRSQKSFIARPRSYDDELVEMQMMESFRGHRRKTFCQQLRIFCQRSTLHGLSDLCRAETWWLRCFWIFTFSLAVAMTFYGCYHIMEQYLESPVVVSYFVQESELNFHLPDLVVCPFNRFNAEFLKNYSVDNQVAQHMQLVFGMSAKHPAQRRELRKYMTPENMTTWDGEMNRTLHRLNMTFDEFLEAASLKCTDFFIDCAFPTGPVECCNNITGIMTFAGKCFRIPGVNQSGPGFGYGMTIVVTLPKQLYSLAVNNWLNDGILVKLAEPGQGIDYDMTFIPVGTHALMPLKATKYEFMDDPPRFVCSNKESVNYSRVDCFDQCFLEAAQNHCRCAMVGNKNRHSWPLCTSSQFYNCLFTYLINQFEEVTDAEHYFFACRQQCKPRCTYWQYQSAVSYSKFPSEEAREFAQSEEEWTQMKNTIILDLYYEKLEFTRIKHYRAMTIHGFVANLGGQYSLWLGGSILTLMQVFVFFFKYGLSRCKRILARRRKRNSSINTGENRDIAYDFHSIRPSLNVFWKKRPRSASLTVGHRRHSHASDDLHPQIQALTEQNHLNARMKSPYIEHRQCQSNGTCRTGNIDCRTSATFGHPFGCGPPQCSSLSDIERTNHWQGLINNEKHSGCYKRSPTTDHFGATTCNRSPCESYSLDVFHQ